MSDELTVQKGGEAVIIGGAITIQLVRVRGENAFLGITAPREVRVDRLEVREAILRRRAGEGGPA